MEVLGFQQLLLTTLHDMWQAGQFCDAVVHTINGSVEAHRVVLLAASRYIRDIELRESHQQFKISHYHLPFGRLEEVKVLLQLLYTGTLSISNENVENLMELCMLLQIEKVSEVCQKFFNGWQMSNSTISDFCFMPEKEQFGVKEDSVMGNSGFTTSEYCSLTSLKDMESSTSGDRNLENLSVSGTGHPEYDRMVGQQSMAVQEDHRPLMRTIHGSSRSMIGALYDNQKSQNTIQGVPTSVVNDIERYQNSRVMTPFHECESLSPMQEDRDDQSTRAMNPDTSLMSDQVDSFAESLSSVNHSKPMGSLVNKASLKDERGTIENLQQPPSFDLHTPMTCSQTQDTDTYSCDVNMSASCSDSNGNPDENFQSFSCSSCDEKFEDHTSFTQHRNLCHSEGLNKQQCNSSNIKTHNNKDVNGIVNSREKNVLEADKGLNKRLLVRSLRNSPRVKLKVESCTLIKPKHSRKKVSNSDFIEKDQVLKSKEGRERSYHIRRRGSFTDRPRVKEKSTKICKDNDNVSWMCAFCKMVFRSKAERAKHRRRVHKPDSYKCVVCKTIFPTLSGLKAHKEEVHPEKIKCFKCQDKPIFSTVSELENHRKKEHVKDKTIRCKICRETFETKEAKINHMDVVHPTGKNCPECNTKFDNWKHLVDHRNHKHNIPFEVNKYDIFSCDFKDCDYQTVDQYRYFCHRRDVHCETRTHTCLTCNSTFKSKRALKSHQEIHLDPNQRNGSQCDQCGKKFLSVTYLKTHIDTMHGTEKKPIKKQFLCHLCPSSFRDKHFFHSHMLRAHEVEPPADLKLHRCTHCDFFTVQKSHLRKHMRHHSTGTKEYECNTCGKKFLTEDCLNRHVQRHQMKDEYCPMPDCGYSTKYKSNLKNHIARIHTQKDLKPYQCSYCDYKCKEKGNLNKHITGKHKMEVMSVAKLRKNAIKTGTGYPNYVTRICSSMSVDNNQSVNLTSLDQYYVNHDNNMPLYN